MVCYSQYTLISSHLFILTNFIQPKYSTNEQITNHIPSYLSNKNTVHNTALPPRLNILGKYYHNVFIFHHQGNNYCLYITLNDPNASIQSQHYLGPHRPTYIHLKMRRNIIWPEINPLPHYNRISKS